MTRGTIYAVITADDTVSVINGATCNSSTIVGCNQTPATVAVGWELLGYDAVDVQRKRLYVSNSLDDTVSVIDTSSCNATDATRCGRTPPAVAINAGGGAIALSADGTPYVTGNAFGPVSFFGFVPPATPTDVTAAASGRRVQLSWTAPAHGGLPIVYTVTPTPACPSCSGPTTPSTSGQPSTTVSGLVGGVPYRFSVRGLDAAGAGPNSAASNPIRP